MVQAVYCFMFLIRLGNWPAWAEAFMLRTETKYFPAGFANQQTEQIMATNSRCYGLKIPAAHAHRAGMSIGMSYAWAQE